MTDTQRAWIRTWLVLASCWAFCACSSSPNQQPGAGVQAGAGGTGLAGAMASAGTDAQNGTAGAAGSAAGAAGAAGTIANTMDASVGMAGASGAAGAAGAAGSGSDASMPMRDASIAQCPAPPSAATPAAVTALNTINMLRLAAGAGCDTMVQAANDSARKHCEYYAANKSNSMCIANAHVEVQGCMSYVAANFGDRMKAAGYTGQAAFEVMAFLNNPVGAVDTWVNSVWHRLPILNPWSTDLGYGAADRCDTIDFGRGTPMPDNTVVVYPYEGQTGLPTSFDGSHEGPMPPTPSTGWPSGSPITAYAKKIAVTEHVLTKDGDSTPIDHIWLTSADSNFLRDDVMMYASKPLAPATKYRVKITGTFVGGALNLDWTFTTK